MAVSCSSMLRTRATGFPAADAIVGGIIDLEILHRRPGIREKRRPDLKVITCREKPKCARSASFRKTAAAARYPTRPQKIVMRIPDFRDVASSSAAALSRERHHVAKSYKARTRHGRFEVDHTTQTLACSVIQHHVLDFVSLCGDALGMAPRGPVAWRSNKTPRRRLAPRGRIRSRSPQRISASGRAWVSRNPLLEHLEPVSRVVKPGMVRQAPSRQVQKLALKPAKGLRRFIRPGGDSQTRSKVRPSR